MTAKQPAAAELKRPVAAKQPAAAKGGAQLKRAVASVIVASTIMSFITIPIVVFISLKYFV